MTGNVRHLRTITRPYNQGLDEESSVQLSDLEWSLLVAGARNSGMQAAVDVAHKVAARQQQQQQLRRDRADHPTGRAT